MQNCHDYSKQHLCYMNQCPVSCVVACGVMTYGATVPLNDAGNRGEDGRLDKAEANQVKRYQTVLQRFDKAEVQQRVLKSVTGTTLPCVVCAVHESDLLPAFCTRQRLILLPLLIAFAVGTVTPCSVSLC